MRLDVGLFPLLVPLLTDFEELRKNSCRGLLAQGESPSDER